MSIALHRNRGIEIDSSGFGLVGRPSIFDSPELDPGDRRSEDGGDGEEVAPSSSESSSIGKNSDVSSDGDCEENEVQSSYKGPLEMMDALEEVLPVRKGISSFYDGKSRSYTSLADASSSSTVKEIAKPENAYSRKRRNLLAFHQIWEKNRTSSLKSNAGGISKRPLSSSKSTLALAVAMSNSESYSSSTSEDSSSSSHSKSPPPLPPLHPQARSSNGHMMSSSSPRKCFSPWRSYSLADLQHCPHTPTKVRFEEPISEKAELEELT